MPAINSRCRQWHKPSFLLLDSFRPVFRQVLKSCTFLFFMLSGLLKPHNHPSLIPLISENQPFPAYSLLSFRECSVSRHILLLSITHLLYTMHYNSHYSLPHHIVRENHILTLKNTISHFLRATSVQAKYKNEFSQYSFGDIIPHSLSVQAAPYTSAGNHPPGSGHQCVTAPFYPHTAAAFQAVLQEVICPGTNHSRASSSLFTIDSRT